MAFDFKKEYKEFYMPKDKPAIITVPKMNYIAVRGKGDPNDETGDYKAAIGLLYGIAFTIKMSKKGDHRIDGYFDYVVPPTGRFLVAGSRLGEAEFECGDRHAADRREGALPAGSRFGEAEFKCGDRPAADRREGALPTGNHLCD